MEIVGRARRRAQSFVLASSYLSLALVALTLIMDLNQIYRLPFDWLRVEFHALPRWSLTLGAIGFGVLSTFIGAALGNILGRSGSNDQPMNLEAAEQFHEQQLHALRSEFDASIASAEDSVARADLMLDEVRSSVGMRAPTYWSSPLYYGFLLILAVLEVPVNRLAFELFFSENAAISALMAFLIALVLVFLGAQIGLSLRRFRYQATEANVFLPLFSLTLLATLLVTLCYALAVLRQGYLATVLSPDSDLAQMLASARYGEASYLIWTAPHGVEVWVFLTLNVCIALVALLAAFFSHDPHPELERLDRLARKARYRLATLQRRRGEALSLEERRYAEFSYRVRSEERA